MGYKDKNENKKKRPEPDYDNWWEISPVLYVSEVLKKAIQEAKLTGLVMEKATVIR